MGLIKTVLDAAVDFTDSTGELAAERLRGLTILAIVILVLVFLLILFLTQPYIGLAVSALIVVLVYLLQDSGDLV